MTKWNRRQLTLTLIGAPIVAAFLILLGIIFFQAQRADFGWDPHIASPTWTTDHPRVLIDEAHYNASTAGITGRYWPFARLLRADGYDVEREKSALTLARLEGAQVLVIANATGAPKPQIFGINVPVRTDKKRTDPAFTPAEVEWIRAWVERGGALLLVADHAPFGAAVAGLGSAFGVTMHKGFVEVPHETSDPLLFSRENGRLGDHPIVNGDSAPTAIQRVMTYTGQSLDGPAGATILLHLPATAVEAVPENDTLVERPAGPAQGLAFEYGKGRVVVLGEGAMVTAQVSRRVPYGMNTPDNDNRQFTLNVLKWLARRL